MVYGSFIAIVFTFLLMWVDATRGGKDMMLSKNFIWGFFCLFAILLFCAINMNNGGFLLSNPLFQFFYFNFYEGLILDLEAELVLLG